MGKELQMDNGSVVDVDEIITSGMKLRCTRCHGGRDERPGGALKDPVRKESDPLTVVRCSECGKKHSTDSLIVDT